MKNATVKYAKVRTRQIDRFIARHNPTDKHKHATFYSFHPRNYGATGLRKSV